MKSLARVAYIAAVIAAIDAPAWILTFCLSDGAVAGQMDSKIDLIKRLRHVPATAGRVVNLVVAVGLCVLVHDKSGHFVTPFSEQGDQRDGILGGCIS